MHVQIWNEFHQQTTVSITKHPHWLTQRCLDIQRKISDNGKNMETGRKRKKNVNIHSTQTWCISEIQRRVSVLRTLVFGRRTFYELRLKLWQVIILRVSHMPTQPSIPPGSVYKWVKINGLQKWRSLHHRLGAEYDYMGAVSTDRVCGHGLRPWLSAGYCLWRVYADTEMFHDDTLYKLTYLSTHTQKSDND